METHTNDLSNNETSPEIEMISKAPSPVTMFHRLDEILTLSEKNFSCSICNDTMVMPTTITCGHTFCAQCIKDWFDTRENCPVCREPCIGGEQSAPVEIISKYLQRLKPLLHYRRLQNVINEDGFPSTQPESERYRLPPEEDEKLVQFIGQTLTTIRTEKDWTYCDKAITIVRMALTSGFNTETILRDVDKLSPKAFLEKYCKFEKKEEYKDYQYVPVTRSTEYEWHWPDRQGWTQIGGYVFFIIILLYVISIAEQSGLYPALETLLRLVIVLSVFEHLFRDLI